MLQRLLSALPPRPWVVAHAAAAGLAPENTLAGVRRALELGCVAVEVDVHATAEGVPVLLHDDTVDRTTDGHGLVETMTLEEVRRLDAGSWFPGGAYSGEPLPTLSEALALTSGRAWLVAEVKQLGIEEAVLAVAREAGTEGWLVVTSFYPQVVQRLQELAPEIPAFRLVETTGEEPQPGPFGGVFVRAQAVTPELVARLHEQGGLLFVWAADEEEELRRLLALGVDAIGTNYPDRLRRVLGEGGDEQKPH